MDRIIDRPFLMGIAMYAVCLLFAVGHLIHDLKKQEIEEYEHDISLTNLQSISRVLNELEIGNTFNDSISDYITEQNRQGSVEFNTDEDDDED